MKRLLGSILKLGAGEAVSKLAGFAFYGYVSRAFGVELLGIVALSQTVAGFVMMGTDLGLRLIGARLVARNANLAPAIIPQVLRKRLISCAVCVSLASIYALWGPVPAGARLYVLGFTLGVLPYAFSLDWLAWGLNHFGWLGTWRGGVGLLFAFGAIAAIRASGFSLLPITIANAASAALGVSLLWALWRFRWRPPHSITIQEVKEINSQFRWAAVLPLGGPTILNLMFNNFDTVILGAMTSAAEVGRYNAAYKILFAIFGGYYLLTQSLYPKLSRMKGGRQARQFLSYALVALGVLGGCLALAVAFWAAPILHTIYGADLNAVYLLRVLAFAIPMDFCTSLLAITMISWGYDRHVLACMGSAAGVNALLNFFLIPRLHAAGSAWATLASYVYLFLAFGTVFLLKPGVFEKTICAPNPDAAINPA
jgi:O-antigen/teichoic acid export membrane protein